MGIREQIDLAEEQYEELVKDFGQALLVLKRLRFKHVQIEKQIRNLEEAVENEQKKLDEQ